MSTREEFADHLWQTIINPLRDRITLERIIEHCKRFPDTSFAEVGPAIERILAAGIAPEDLCLINSSTAYEAVFGTLYALGDPGVDGDDVFGLYEILGTSPSAKWDKPAPPSSD
ncbi:MAG TPA: hypothetical protein VJ806_15410 [Luteimonas sp.]|nr:hypothetical protein [Luteimonas sp.]